MKLIKTGARYPNRSPAGVAREEAAPAAGVSGICTFDEFVKEVSLKTHWVSWNEVTITAP